MQTQKEIRANTKGVPVGESSKEETRRLEIRREANNGSKPQGS